MSITALWLYCTALSFGGLLIIRRSQDEKNSISRKIRQFFEEDIDSAAFFCACVVLLIFSLFYGFMNFGLVLFKDNLQVMEAIILLLAQLKWQQEARKRTEKTANELEKIDLRRERINKVFAQSKREGWNLSTLYKALIAIGD